MQRCVELRGARRRAPLPPSESPPLSRENHGEIIDGAVWQGGRHAVEEAAKQVDCVVDLTSRARSSSAALPEEVSRVEFPMRDGPLPDLKELDDLVLRLANRIEQGDRLYLHCSSGINRSGLVGALLIRELEDCTGPEAVSRLEDRTAGSVLRNSRFREYVKGLGQP